MTTIRVCKSGWVASGTTGRIPAMLSMSYCQCNIANMTLSMPETVEIVDTLNDSWIIDCICDQHYFCRKYEKMLTDAFETAFNGTKVQFDFLQQIKKLEKDNEQTLRQIADQKKAFQQQVNGLTAQISDTRDQQREAEQVFAAIEESMQMEITNLHQKVAEAQNDEEKQELRKQIEAHRVESENNRREHEAARRESEQQMAALNKQMSEMKIQRQAQQREHDEQTRQLQEEFQQYQDRRRREEQAVRNQSSGPSNWFTSILGTAVPLIANAAVMALPGGGALATALKVGGAAMASGVASKIFNR